MNILLAGDSWAEAVRFEGQQFHPGLQEFFKQQRHQVDNVGFGGLSNSEIVDRIQDYLHTNPAPDLLVVYFTCPLREFKTQTQIISDAEIWCRNHWQGIFARLATLKEQHGFKVLGLAGLADIDANIPHNLDYMLHSTAEYLLPDHHRYLFGDFTYLDRAFGESHSKYTAADNIHEKFNQWFRYIHQTFRTDGAHPNTQGFSLIFDEILKLIPTLEHNNDQRH